MHHTKQDRGEHVYLTEHDRRREVVHQPEQDRWQEGGSAQLQEIKDVTHVSCPGCTPIEETAHRASILHTGNLKPLATNVVLVLILCLTTALRNRGTIQFGK